MGEKSILHAVKVKNKPKLSEISGSVVEENEEQGSEPLCNTLKDVMFSNEDRTQNNNIETNLNGNIITVLRLA